MTFVSERIDMKSHPIVKVISLLFIFIFVYTATSKLINLSKFQTALITSPLLRMYALPLSYAVPILELVISFMLFTQRLQKASLWAATILMAMFTVYILYMVLYIPHLPCSCGGITGKMSWRQHLVFNTVLILLGSIAIIFFNKHAHYTSDIQQGASRKPVTE